MSHKTVLRAIALSSFLLLAVPAFAAEDASMHQVYAAAQAGKLDEAQSMMAQVLRDHPNSAKAHFVEAELLTKQGRIAGAQTELETAERLAPGLPFANPGAVQKLRARLSAPAVHRTAVQQEGQMPSGGGIPWTLLIAGAGLIGFIVFAVGFMNRRNAPGAYAVGMPGAGPGAPMQAYGPGYGPASPGQMMGAPAGSGIGSGILGGLATGAAMGAGIVAGEALVHHFTDGNRGNGNNSGNGGYDPTIVPDQAFDMGGTDFGIADNSSWDSGSSSGNDDWN